MTTAPKASDIAGASLSLRVPGEPAGVQPPSPTSLALASLNMTRDDLARHTDQMRSFLSTTAPSLHVLSQEQQDQLPSVIHSPPSPSPAPSVVKSEINESLTLSASRPSMDAVLEGKDRRKRDARKKQSAAVAATSGSSNDQHQNGPAPRSDVPSTSYQSRNLSRAPSTDASRASSVAWSVSLVYQQDVFYSRPPSVAPSSSLSHPSLRRSQSASSQLSAAPSPVIVRGATRGDDVGGEPSTSMATSDNIDSAQPQKQSKPAYPPPSVPASSAYDVTPLKRQQSNDSHKTPYTANVQVSIPSSSSATAYTSNIPSSSPVVTLKHDSSSPADPRTPYRTQTHQLKPLATSARRPPNGVQSSSPMVPATSSPAVDASPSNPAALPFRLPAGPRLTSKPHYSYAALIGQALMSSPTSRLSLNQIYTWISLAYPYFKRGEAGWQNSIRHNLSLNGCFIKIKREDGEKGKGSWWGIRPGDEPCFAGGGFQRQGRANGRKRKGKADKEPEMSDAEAIESTEEGASPKKKKPITPIVTDQARNSARRSGQPYSRSASTSTTATSVHTLVSTTSYDSASSYAANGYGLPAYYPYGPHPSAYVMSYRPQSAQSEEHSERTLPPPVVLTRIPPQAGYPMRTQAAPSSPLASRSAPSTSMTSEDSDDELESEDGQHESMAIVKDYDAPLQEKYQEVSNERHPDPDAIEEDQEPAEAQDPANETLGMAFSMSDPVPPSSGHGTSTRDSLASAASSTLSTESTSLQPGFTFVPPAKGSPGKPVPGVTVKAEPITDDETDQVDLNLTGNDDDYSSFFHSSPIPQSHQRTRPASTSPSKSRHSTNAAGSTDLLSRVLESKALKRGAGHGHQSSSSGGSSASKLFPVAPSTPKRTRDTRPVTPPRSSKRLVDSEEDKLLKNMDPSVAAAVTALTSLSPMRTPVSHAAFHMSPAPPPSSDLTHYKHSLGPPASPFRTPARSTGGAASRFDYYDYLNDGPAATPLGDDAFPPGASGGRTLGSMMPRTPATPLTSGLFGSSALYQSPSLPSPGWRRL